MPRIALDEELRVAPGTRLSMEQMLRARDALARNMWARTQPIIHGDLQQMPDFDRFDDENEIADPDPPRVAAKPRLKKKKDVFYNQKVIDFNKFLLGAKKQDGEIGIEIEVEGKNLFTTPLQWWTCTTDGSLRNHDGHPPYEYLLKKPIDRNQIKTALSYLSKKQAEKKAEFFLSDRTSVHVHVNCQQMTLKEVAVFVCLYLLFESALTEFAGAAREGNLFCQRAKDSEYWIHSLVEAYRTGNFSVVFSDNFRYTACNTAALGKLGSLEFRALRGTMDMDLIQTWIAILLHLKDESFKFSDPMDVYEKYFVLGNNDFFRMVWGPKPELEAELTRNCQTIDLGMKEGSYFVRDIAMSVEEWKPPMTKEQLQEGEQSLPFDQRELPEREYLSAGVFADPFWRNEGDETPHWWVHNTNPDTRICTFKAGRTAFNGRRKYLFDNRGRYLNAHEAL